MGKAPEGPKTLLLHSDAQCVSVCCSWRPPRHQRPTPQAQEMVHLHDDVAVCGGLRVLCCALWLLSWAGGDASMDGKPVFAADTFRRAGAPYEHFCPECHPPYNIN